MPDPTPFAPDDPGSAGRDDPGSAGWDARRHAPATERNRVPLLEVLRSSLPSAGLVLEVASGTGQHARFFAEAFPRLTWQPSDPDPEARASIAAWRADAAAGGGGGLPNLLAPLALDAASDGWPLDQADAVLCVNMIHIAPWDATLGLFRESLRLLPPGGPLLLYGPYRRGGRHTADSNAAFDAGLRARNPAWGVRDLAEVLDAAAGFTLAELVEMPANNLTLLLRKD